MRSWSRSSVAAALVAAISTGILFCPCAAEASEHGGCSKTTTALRGVSGDCCNEQVPSNAPASATASTLITSEVATAAPQAPVPASEVRSRVPHLISIHTQPLVLRI